MGSANRRWFWVAAVALVAGLLWWTQTRDGDRVDAPPRPEPVVAEPAPEPPPSEPEAVRERPEPGAEGESEPIATPLPRDEVQLPATGAPDGGVDDDDPASIEVKRDRMLGVVLEQLEEDLRAAEEAGDEQRAARIRVRRDRLEQQRNELTAQ